MLRKLTAVGIVAAALAQGSDARAADPVPGYIRDALADPARPADQLARDVDRKAAEVLAFAGIKPGDKVADFMSGGAYFTRLFSRVAGANGRVYAFVPDEELRNCAPEETDGTFLVQRDKRYANVSLLVAPVNAFAAPETLDLVWTAQNFHDLFDPFMSPANVPHVTASIFAALKPGGVFLVIDHAGEPGSGTRDTDTLHRIDSDVIVHHSEAAGFRLEARSDLLRNPRDTHALRVFDPVIRGHTDQVILKFRKPATASGT